MSDSVLVAIAALFCTSCLVRVVPAFISLQIDPQRQRYLERLLPTAVFINFAVYIAYTEAMREPVAAMVSLAVVGGIAFFNLLGLIGTAALGSVLYFALVSSRG